MEKPGKRAREQTGVGEGKKKKIYGGERWRAVRGWGEGEGAVVIMGDNRQLRIDKMELWKVEVKAKLNNAIETAMRNAQEAEEGTAETSFSKKVNEAGEENERQTVTIGQVTTAVDITQELLDNICYEPCCRI